MPSCNSDPAQWAEFLDEPSRNQPWQPSLRDAWRRGPYAAVAVNVPLEVVARLATPARLATIRHDQERLDKITAELAKRGLDQPLILVIDALGCLTLMDGHHRVLCATALGWDRIAVRVVTADRVRTHAVPARDLFGDLLRAVSELAVTPTTV